MPGSIFDNEPTPARPSIFDEDPAPARPTSSVFDEETAPMSSGSKWGIGAALGGAAAAGAYALSRNPQVASRIGNELLDTRQVSMLSGLAGLKSTLGNVGSAAYSSVEHGTWAPLKALISGDTVQDFKNAWKAGSQYVDSADRAPTFAQKFNVFGKFMGSADTAAQQALVRAGTHTPEEAAIEMLQRPLPKSVAESLDSPIMRYAVPFRRTPFNQFMEGGRTIGDWSTRGKVAANAASLTQGAATGYTTDDPTATAMSVSLAGKRGLGVAVGDVLGRLLRGESAGSAGRGVQGMSPVADTSLGQSVTQPFTDPISMYKPAAVSALGKLLAMFGK